MGLKEGKRFNLTLLAVASLVGTVIGAGIFGIPYAFAKSGFIVGVINLLVLGIAMFFVHLCFSEVTLRTKGNHQIPGYAGKYLGKFGKIGMVILLLFELFGALIAYTMAEGEILSFIFTSSLDSSLVFSLLFLCLVGTILFFNLKSLEKSELIGFIAIMFIVFLIIIFFLPKGDFSNLSYISNNFLDWFFPFGVILFALSGISTIPLVKEELRYNERLFKRTILWSTIISVVVYFLFSMSVVAFSGNNTPEIATMALGKIPSLFAFFAMFTSFIAIGYAIKETFMRDYKLKNFASWLIVMIPVLIISLVVIFTKVLDFVGLIGLIGSVAVGLISIMLLIMYKKAKTMGDRIPEFEVKIPWWIIFIFILLFITGIVYNFVF